MRGTLAGIDRNDTVNAPPAPADMTELLVRLAVALAVGLLVGLERGWKLRDEEDGQRAAGFRTFALTGLLGGISGTIALATDTIILGFLFIGFIAAFAAFHWLEATQNKDVSVTSVVAGMLTFAIGAYAAIGNLRVAVASAVATVLLLALRQPLHRWVEALRWEEIRAVLILLTMTFLLLPILPNRPIDPWGAINPASIWLLAIMIAAISFGGYVAVRLFGGQLGIVMAAISGGLASSTATTLTLAKLAKGQDESARVLAAGILIAGAVMMVRVLVVASLLNRAMLIPLVPPLAGLGIVTIVAAAILLFGKSRDQHAELNITNPLELGTAIKLAIIIAIVMFAAEAVHDALGNSGMLVVAAAAGVADVDAMTISMSRLALGRITPELAAQAIALAVYVNTLSKAVMAASAGGRRIGLYVGAASLLGVGAGVATLLLI
jgi:uncharacterized membrane protein (DUF4010 family)